MIFYAGHWFSIKRPGAVFTINFHQFTASLPVCRFIIVATMKKFRGSCCRQRYRNYEMYSILSSILSSTILKCASRELSAPMCVSIERYRSVFSEYLSSGVYVQ